MKILLIQPFICLENSYPLGLAYLASALIKGGHHVWGYDFNIQNEFSLEEVITQNKIDLIGISIWTVNRDEALRLASLVKEKSNIPIVVGGPDVTLNYAEIMLHNPQIDYAVVGEGENTLLNLLSQLAKIETDLVPGVAYRVEDSIKYIPSTEQVDLDELPFPNRKLFPIKKYQTGTISSSYPYAPLIMSRGCPNTCHYCSAPDIWKGSWRSRDPINVLIEMEYLSTNFGIACFHFEDDNILADKKGFIRFLDLLISLPEKYYWECCNGVRPEQLSAELIKKMAVAGCKSISLSIETLNPVLQKWSDRYYSFDQIKSLVGLLRESGIKAGGYFIIGLEKRKEWLSTLCSIPKLRLDSMKFSIVQNYTNNMNSASQNWCYRMRIFSYLYCYMRPGQLWSVIVNFKHLSFLKLFLKKIFEIFRKD